METQQPDYRLFYSVNLKTLQYFNEKKQWMADSTHREFHRLVKDAAPEAFDLNRVPDNGILAMRDYTGSKEEIEVAALALSSIMHTETRARLFNVTTKIEGTNHDGLQSERDYIPEADLLIPTPETTS